MARSQRGPGGAGSRPWKAKLPLPNPKSRGPFQPGLTGWGEAWWWFGISIAIALFIVSSYAIDWNRQWVTGESGVLETAQFIVMVIGFAIAVNFVCTVPWGLP